MTKRNNKSVIDLPVEIYNIMKKQMELYKLSTDELYENVIFWKYTSPDIPFDAFLLKR